MMVFSFSVCPCQGDRAIKALKENKRDQEIYYTMTVSDARTKDSGNYACSITDIMSNESQTKELTITVYGKDYKLKVSNIVFINILIVCITVALL